MKFILKTALRYSAICMLSQSAYASPFTFGEIDHKYGQLQVSGWLRANIQDKSYSDDEHKLKFDAAKLELKYTREQFHGDLEYRCYQFDQLCDFSALVDANISYHFQADHLVKLGIQEIPFGPARSWSSNWYGGLLVNMGLEDVHNLGIKYQYPISPNTQLELAYFRGDAGKYTGKSRDAARYTANFVASDLDNSHLKEKNMWLIRAQHQFPITTDEKLKANVGASYWLSDIENKTLHKTSDRQSWALFGQLDYQPLKLSLTAGHNKVDNSDPISPDQSIVGSFDSTYAVANQGYFYTADVLYQFTLANASSISPYATFSQLRKSSQNFSDSTRYILGAQWDYKNFALIGEYIIAKNDAFIGGNAQSFAQGDPSASHETLLNLIFLYKF